MTLQYRVGSASLEQIYSHLKKCDTDFLPPLSRRVDLHEYARKVFEQAVSFEAWEDDALVGMVNAYLNDASKQTCFITNVSVLREYRRKGIASTLLAMCSAHARDLKFQRVKLEVSRENVGSIRVAALVGLEAIGENGDCLVMGCELTNRADAEGPPITSLIQGS